MGTQTEAWSPGKKEAVFGSPSGPGRNTGPRESSLRTWVEFQGGWVPLPHRHLRLQSWAGRDGGGGKESRLEQVLWEEDLDCAGRRVRLGVELRDGMLVGRGLGKAYVGKGSGSRQGWWWGG